MPTMIEGIEYLNTTESRKFLGWSLATFSKYTKHLKRTNILGKHGVFFRKDDLEEFKQFLPQEVKSE